MHTVKVNSRSTARPLTAAWLGSVALALLAPSAVAQQAADASAAELPPVVVQGATLQTKRTPAPPEPRAGGDETDSAENAKLKKPNAMQRASQTAGSSADGGSGADASGTEAFAIPAERLGSSVTVVTGKELRERQVQTVGDALRSLPGVAISQQGPAGSVTVARIRGGESRHTLVLIDGVEVNSATDGLVDFANLATADIERIELLRGPQSSIYGNNAMAGVVNIITKSGRGPLTLRLTGEAGSLNTQGGSLQVSGGTDRAWGSVMLSSRRTDGFNIAPIGNEKDGSRLNTFTFTGGVRPIDGLQIDATWRRSRLFSDFDGFEGWLDGFQVANDYASTSERSITLGRLATTLELLDKHLITTGYLTQGRNNYFATDVSPIYGGLSSTLDETTAYGVTSTYRLDGPVGLPVRHFLTGLAEQRHESFVQTLPHTTDKDRDRASYAGELRGEYWNQLFLGASLRYDDNSDYDDYTTWHAQGSLKVPGTVLRLHASGGTGVKYPTFSDLYGFYLRYVPNPLLKPETSLGWDIGTEATLWGGRTMVDVTYFQSDLRNAFEADYSNYPLITTVNLPGISHRRGVEVSLKQRLTDSIVITAAYTFTDSRDDKGEESLRRPRHTARATADWSFADGRGHFGIAVAYNGDMNDVAFRPDFTSTVKTLEDYWLVGITASYKLTPNMELFGRIENALDQRYQDVFGYDATSGVTAYAGVKLTFEDPSTASWAKYRE